MIRMGNPTKVMCFYHFGSRMQPELPECESNNESSKNDGVLSCALLFHGTKLDLSRTNNP